VDLHQQCTALGGKFVWVFDVPFTHYICQVGIYFINKTKCHLNFFLGKIE
jgi:hypothetical protein